MKKLLVNSDEIDNNGQLDVDEFDTSSQIDADEIDISSQLDADEVDTSSQFHQHFTSSYSSDFQLPKKLQSQIVSSENLRIAVSYEKPAQKS